MQNTYDVIIVGAGAGGSSTAYFLSQHNLRVLVIEKCSLPRYKACGGGVSLKFLNRIFPFSFDPVIEKQVDSLRYQFLGIDLVVPIPQGEMAMVMRDQFDNFILSHTTCDLLQASVTRVVESSDLVSVTTDQQQVFYSKYLVAADGVNSLIRKHIFPDHIPTRIPAIEAEVIVPESIYQNYCSGPTFIFSKPRFGYLWIFPKKHSLSIGIASRGLHGSTLKTILKQEMLTRGISLENVPLHGHTIPVCIRHNRLATKRIFLVGDAASLVDPLSGEGIRPAILSGCLASQAIISGNPLSYPHQVDRQIRRHFIASTIVSYLFYPLRELCLLLGAPNPFASQLITQIIAGEKTSLDLFLWSILTLPVYLTTEIIGECLALVRGSKARDAFLDNVYGYFQSENQQTKKS
ncbi:MAG TPA: geranylgeranyl reductase family protein [Anaerolineaceae bacterium]